MAQQPPFFDASRLAFWHPDEYRIYVLPEELLFLRTAAYGLVPHGSGCARDRRGGSTKPT